MYMAKSITAVVTTTNPQLASPAPLHTHHANTVLAKGGGNSQLQRWSSLIGIITAIVGNILISFALNLQRYAHIRINRERECLGQTKRLWRKSKPGYGTTTIN